MPIWFPTSEPCRTTIGPPQPELVTLVEQGAFQGEVLDVGCGTGGLALLLAANGYSTVGLDLSEAAISLARSEARRLGLERAEFQVADVTSFTGYDGRFGTVVDGALFHTIPPSFRSRYQEAIVRAAAPGAWYFVLVFDRAGMPDGVPVSAVTAAELVDAVSAHWVVDDIQRAHIHGHASEPPPRVAGQSLADRRVASASTNVVISSDKPFPAWLLSAHLRVDAHARRQPMTAACERPPA